MPKLSEDGKNTFLEFSFTQEERDDVLRFCSLRDDHKKRFRKIVAVGSTIKLVFYKKEAEDMLESLSQAVLHLPDDKNPKKRFEDLHARFESEYNEVFK